MRRKSRLASARLDGAPSHCTCARCGRAIRGAAAERKFVEGIGQARLSRMLVSLRQDVPIRMPWEEP